MRGKYLLMLAALLPAWASAQNLTVGSLRSNYKTNPVGVDGSNTFFSWKLSSPQRGTMQDAYELRVALTESDVQAGKNLVWTSGKVKSEESVYAPYNGPKQVSRQRYFWQVRVWDNHHNTSAWSSVNYWETGLTSASDWSAKWIETAKPTDGKVGPAPMFANNFYVNKTVKQARLYITSHGLYEARLNGARVGNAMFTPGWTSYKNRLQYQTYDVTGMLKQGKNAALVTVGDGWYRGNLEFQFKRNVYGKEVGLLFQLELIYADGTRETITSNESWHSSVNGPVRLSDIYNGETYDARLRTEALAQSFSGKDWDGVRVADYGYGNLVSPLGPSVLKHEVFYPAKFIHTPKGETVIDFGQNLVGWVRFRLKGAAGDTITINHAEVLDKAGNFYTENLRNARCENKYVLTGADDVFEPHFTFQGFRYCKITGYKGKLDTSSLQAVAIYSDMAPTGNLTTSNALLNQLQHNIQWGQRGNFLDVPTDCPQRDERLGWTGDAEVFFNTAAYNMDVAGFFSKWLMDLKVDQHADGNVPVVIPDVRKPQNAGSAGWGDVATIIPWNFYQAYGDKNLLLRQYPSMKAWVEYIRSIAKDNLWNSGPHYGDWLFYTMADDRDGKAAITDKYLIAQAFYAYSTQNLINAAKVLERQTDVIAYTALLSDIKKAFLNEYVTPSGRMVSNSQTAYVLALQFDLLPDNLRAQAAARLADNIKLYGNHLTTGFLGTPHLCHVLSRFGYTDLAYKLLLQDTYPSWLYPVKMGATTIWERWDGIKPNGEFQAISMNSFNHYAYGAIGDWMYKVMAGINPDDSAPGYKKFVIAPKPGGELTNTTANFESQYGKIISAWKLADNKLMLDVTVPPNTTAHIVLPGTPSAAVVEGGLPLNKAPGLKDIDTKANNTEMTAGSGTYHFEYPVK